MFNKDNYDKIAHHLDEKTRILCVTKGQTTPDVMAAINHGIKLFGESYIQEADEKIKILKDIIKEKKVEFHFIGHLQSNKTRKAVALFDCIQSVDSIKLADLIDTESLRIGKKMPILIEINSGEKSKTGAKMGEIDRLINHAKSKKNILLNGLMCIPEKGREEEIFNMLNHLARKYSLNELSMGMSDDYPIALKYGSTMIRIGTALFQERKAD